MRSWGSGLSVEMLGEVAQGPQVALQIGGDGSGIVARQDGSQFGS
ncbi:hypothetical protein [Paracoccus ravus]|nr:hypothetical protein [Paracoccus ravus]